MQLFGWSANPRKLIKQRMANETVTVRLSGGSTLQDHESIGGRRGLGVSGAGPYWSEGDALSQQTKQTTRSALSLASTSKATSIIDALLRRQHAGLVLPVKGCASARASGDSTRRAVALRRVPPDSRR